MKKIGDVFTLIRNGASIKQYDNAGGLPITRIETISNKFIDREKMGYADIDDDGKYDDYILQDGDILMSHINSERHLGKVALYNKFGDEKIIHGMNLLVLRADLNCIVPKYARLYFGSGLFLRQIATITKKSVNQASFSLTALKELDIICSDIDVQRGVVAKLEKIEALIGHRKLQLQKLDELVKARFVEMFGDIVVNTHSLPALLLKDLALLITKGASPNWQGFNYVEDEKQTLFVTSENVREGYLDFSKTKYIEDGFNEKQKRSVLKKGDFLINIVGASIGRAAQFKIDKKANINQAVALVRVEDERIVDGYLLEYLNSEKAIQMYLSMQSDTGRANLSLEDIGNLVILLPTVKEQRMFADFVKQIDKSKLSVQKSLEKLETLKKALMQKYFG